MARIRETDEKIHLELTLLEKIGAFHGNLSMNISEISSIETVENPWNSKIMAGVRAPGTGVPYLIMLGTLRNFRGWKAFCAIYKRKPAVIINFISGPYSSWIVTTDSLISPVKHS